MGKAAYVRIENHTPERFEVSYGDFSCMRRGGDEGSDFGPISGWVEPRERLPLRADWQYIEKETGALSSCNFQDGRFSMTLRDASQRRLAQLEFQASNGGYTVVTREPEGQPPHPQRVDVAISAREGGKTYQIRVAILQRTFSRSMRLRLAASYLDASSSCCLVPHYLEGGTGEGRLSVWGSGPIWGGGRGPEYEQVPISLIEPVHPSDPTSGVTLAFPSSAPDRPTLYVTPQVQKDSNHPHIVLHPDRHKAARLCPEISEQGLFFRLLETGQILSIAGGDTEYQDQRMDGNRLDSGIVPRVQYFRLPRWDARHFSWGSSLVIASEVDGRRHYLGVEGDRPAVCDQPCSWRWFTDPFTCDLAEGGCLAYGDRFLAKRPPGARYDALHPFTLTPDIEQALRLFPVRLGPQSFGLWEAGTLKRLALSASTELRFPWLAGASHDDPPGHEECFLAEPDGRSAEPSEPRYWIRHRSSGKVLTLRDPERESTVSLVLDQRAALETQLWKLQRRRVCWHVNGAPLTLAPEASSGKRRLTVSTQEPARALMLEPGALYTDDQTAMAAEVSSEGWTVTGKTRDATDAAQAWDLVQYQAQPSFKRNLLELWQPGQRLVLIQQRDGRVLTAVPKERRLGLSWMVSGAGTDATEAHANEPVPTQAWTYHDGVLASQADKSLVLTADLQGNDAQGNVRLVPFGSHALRSQRWGLSADGYLLLRNGQHQVLSFDEAASVLCLRSRYDREAAHEDCQKWTLYPC